MTESECLAEIQRLRKEKSGLLIVLDMARKIVVLDIAIATNPEYQAELTRSLGLIDRVLNFVVRDPE